MSRSAHELARGLISIGAVSFSPDTPYRWASGLLSPMYCDNRKTLAHPEIRALIGRSFEDLLRENGLRPDAIVGVATGAIAHGALLAERLRLPFGYVRTAAKKHGKKNQIEGFSEEGSRVVIVEDLISTGGSSIAAVRATMDAGIQVDAVVAIFTYGFSVSSDAFAEEQVPLHAIVKLSDLMEAASETGQFDESDRRELELWRSDPVAWSKERSEMS